MRYEPFGQDWLQAATIATAACNPHLKRPIKAEEFIPSVKRTQTPEEIEAAIIASCR